MNYFEVKERLEILLRFRKLYAEYRDFTNRFSNPAAAIVRNKMEPLALMTVDALKRVHLGSLMTRTAPSQGGRKIKINLIKAIFRDNVVHDYNLDDKDIIKVLDSGIQRYRSLLWKQKIQLFNPLFWFLQFTAFLAMFPVHIARKSGYDIMQNEEAPFIRLFVFCFQVVCFYALFKSIGLIDWFIVALTL